VNLLPRCPHAPYRRQWQLPGLGGRTTRIDVSDMRVFHRSHPCQRSLCVQVRSVPCRIRTSVSGRSP